MLKIYLIIFRNNYKFQKNKEEVIVIGKTIRSLKSSNKVLKLKATQLKSLSSVLHL